MPEESADASAPAPGGSGVLRCAVCDGDVTLIDFDFKTGIARVEPCGHQAGGDQRQGEPEWLGP